jgi:osmotically-inducible protein OsmY
MLKRTVFSLLFLSLIGASDYVAAQMFSNQVNRPSLSERLRSRQRSRLGTGPESAEAVGTIEGTERFLRGNRSTADFVGADTRDQTTFVGAQAADISADVRTAVEDLRPTRERDLNVRMQVARGKQLYNPRLRVDFAFTAPSSAEVGAQLVNQLQATETFRSLGPIEVSVVDGTAILRGVVASARDREIAALLARFEPGIGAVKNELQVRPVPPPEPSGPVNPPVRRRLTVLEPPMD